MTRSLLLTVALFAAFPAAAQDLSTLPQRPIARAEVIAVVKHQFAEMDANHDGVVTPVEFDRYRARQGAAPATGVGALAHVGGHWFEHTDTAGNGRVTLAEAEVRPLRLFDMADANGDGTVSLQERQMASTLMALTGR